MVTTGGRERRAVSGAVVVGCSIVLVTGWNATNIGAIASETAAAYGIGLAAVGLFTTALLVAHSAIQIPGGKASDRFGARRVGLIGLATIAAGSALSLIAPDPALALATRAITGAGTGLTFIGGSAYVRASGGSALAQGILGGVGIGGGGLALALVPQLELEFGWRASYVSSAVLAGAALLALAIVPADPPHSPRNPDRPRPAAVLNDRRLFRLAVLYAASLGLSLVIANWVVEMLIQHGGADGATAGLVGALTLGLAVFTRPLGGWILRVHPRRIRAAVGASLVAGALGTVALIAAEPLWLAAAGCLLIGFAAGIPFSPAFTGAATVRPDAPAASVGMVNTAGNLAAVIGTPLLGLSFALPGDGRIGFAAAVALWLLALALLPSARSLGAGEADRLVPKTNRGARREAG